MDTYCHRVSPCHVIPFLMVKEDGFIFKGKHYEWESVESLQVRMPPLGGLLGTPRAVVRLTDGECIRINGRALERQNVRQQIRPFTRVSESFIELISLFRRRSACSEEML